MTFEKKYDCAACPAFCCTAYSGITITESDTRRLARHVGLTVDLFLSFYALRNQEGDVILKRKPDPASGDGQSCVFLNTDTRRCTVYDARPEVCREFPHRPSLPVEVKDRCPYFDLYQYTKNEQGDPDIWPFIQLKRVVK